MIKIAFVIDTIESPTAGTEKQLLMLIRHLDRTRFQPCLCVLRSSTWLQEEFDLCPLFVAGINSFKNLRGVWGIHRLAGFLKDEGFHCVQAHFRDASIAGIIAARLAGVRMVIGTRRNQGYWMTSIELTIQRQLNRWVTGFLANSENTRQWAAHTEGISLGKIEVIHNSLEAERFFRATDEQRASFKLNIGFPSDAIVIGIVANLRPVKSVATFVRAVAAVTEKVPLVHGVIVGDGPERPALAALGAELGIQSKVRFLGSRTDIPEILSCLDIGVLSSSSESFSNAVVEYMAAGLAVVCTDVGGAREAVEDGVSGYLVEPGNPVQMADRLLGIIEQHSAASMGEYGRARVAELFGCAGIIAQYERYYETKYLSLAMV